MCGLYGITWVIHCKRDSGGSELERNIGRCYAAGFEHGGRSHQPRNAVILEAEKGTNSALEPAEETQPY